MGLDGVCHPGGVSRKSWCIGAAASAVAILVIAVVRARRGGEDLTGWLIHDLEGVTLPSAHAFGDDYWDCGCPDLYFCPAAGEVQCSRHSGFSVCCDREADHVPLRTLPREEDIVDGSFEHEWVDLVAGGTESPRRWRPVVPARRARVTAQTYRGRTVSLDVDVVGRARGSVLIAQERPHGWPTWHTWIGADQADLEPGR